jgi:hypothetical protein
MGNQRRSSGTIEAIQDHFIGFRKQSKQSPHQGRRQLAWMINSATIVLQAMDIVPSELKNGNALPTITDNMLSCANVFG